jgi:threonine/homoserine/homoserine lactone efflux protein
MGSHLLAFTGVVVLITLVPGIDTALVTRNVVARGRRAGIITALGTSTGLCIHVVAVALGVSIILLRSAEVFTVVKLVGAAYLTVLGLLSLHASFRRDGHLYAEPVQLVRGRRLPGLTNPYMQGLLTNLTNPKAPLFFLTVLPQFVTAGSPLVPQLLTLTAIPVALTISWLSLYATLVGRIAAFLRRPTVRRGQDCALGVIFVGFGVRLALERR